MSQVFRKFNFKNALINLLVIFVCFFMNTQGSYSQDINTSFVTDKSKPIVEYIRLSVPSKYKKAWLDVEHKTWQKWLSNKEGFIERKIFWDPNKEEGILLITWVSRSKWKSIPLSEIDSIQSSFESLAMEATGNSESNPFPLKSEGEFWPQ